ncbi:MAG TPA: hypothetical protein VEJ18_10605 [Planctomycetota bacterium]|nr:hypothetical protein [Planctomycetota bacterium]
MRTDSGVGVPAMNPPLGVPAQGRTLDASFRTILARLLVKAMKSTLRDDGPLSGGSGPRLFGSAMEEVLSEVVASRLSLPEGTGGASPYLEPRPEHPEATL